jgi:hypothetical protein
MDMLLALLNPVNKSDESRRGQKSTIVIGYNTAVALLLDFMPMCNIPRFHGNAESHVHVPMNVQLNISLFEHPLYMSPHGGHSVIPTYQRGKPQF